MTVRRTVNSLILIISANLIPLLVVTILPFAPQVLLSLVAVLCLVAVVRIVIRPLRQTLPTKALRRLANGCELLRLFLISATATVAVHVVLLCMLWPVLTSGYDFSQGMAIVFGLSTLLLAILVESVVFWSGMLRIYLTSVQLGVKHRVLAALCGWIPGLNIWYLLKIIRIVQAEVELETEKAQLNAARDEQSVCCTRYPLLLVHGVFFRDFRYVNYWGRIPSELQRNGAAVYYGQQQSAASVEECGRELAQRIREIVAASGCGKVNIIAHSKGGLDSRAALAHFGAADYVASLTTINTPHRGCLFADYLLEKLPESTRLALASTYNAALAKLGDTSPDFLAAVADLTAAACAERNQDTPDADGVWYQSVCSFCRQAASGRFPLNVSYPLVKHFDGQNDGLVAVASAQWGEHFTLLEPSGARGISHGDMIDLNRENIPGFDVREFYVQLAADLKQRGY